MMRTAGAAALDGRVRNGVLPGWQVRLCHRSKPGPAFVNRTTPAEQPSDPAMSVQYETLPPQAVQWTACAIQPCPAKAAWVRG